MENVFHKAVQRGHSNHGWLKAAHSFSFANYFDSEKNNFGKLRVLNDDTIAPLKGFELHPHHNMEIVTIPISGTLRHTDNMGIEKTISTGEVQVISAGSGIWHSEFNASDSERLNLFQIWIYSKSRGNRSRYEQKAFSETQRINNWQLLVSPKGKNESLTINQEAYLSVINSKKLPVASYQLNKQGNGVYFMLIEGEAEIADKLLQKRDAVGVWSFYDPLEIRFLENSKLLAIEVPIR
jgi:redox-sensitive bicupin YhaK (pirin superfamily)